MVSQMVLSLVSCKPEKHLLIGLRILSHVSGRFFLLYLSNVYFNCITEDTGTERDLTHVP